MSSIRVLVIGYFIITISIVFFTLVLITTASEYFGISKYLLDNLDNDKEPAAIKLKNDDYYKYTFDSDPYEKFTVQYLHPYYLFSLPWRNYDNTKKSSEVIGISSDGFRINPSNSKLFSKKAVLLGGSTAFGHFSSSDENTIASNLSKLMKINIVNRNAPSWNSHQELIALAKFNENYDLSLSFTLFNDIAVACYYNKYWLEGSNYIDAPENFFNLIDRVYYTKKNVLFNFPKKILRSIYPETYLLFSKLKNNFLNSSNKFNKNINNNLFCGDIKENEITLSFLNNQTSMAQISKARGANHIIILQPHIYELYNKIDELKFINSVYDTVIQSQYCKKNICIDLRNTKISLNKDYLYNGSNLSSAFFADKVHLLDKGVYFYSHIIAENLKKF